MLILKKGEAAKKEPIVIDIEAKSVKVNHIWKADKDAEKRYQLTFTYDFSGVSEEDVWRFAAMWVNKDFQNRMRADVPSEEKLEELEAGSIDVAEMYTRRARGPVDPKAAIKKYAAQLSEADREAFLAELFGSESGKKSPTEIRKESKTEKES